MRYNTISIPTTYKGKKYRSRIEAFFAAYVDLYPLPFRFAMYEAYRIYDYTPDFDALVEIGKDCLFPCVIEIKPDFRMLDFQKYKKAMTHQWCEKFYFLAIQIKNDKLSCMVLPPNAGDTMYSNEKGDTMSGAALLQDCLNNYFSKSQKSKNRWHDAKQIVYSQNI